MSRLSRTLGASVLAATAITGIGASAASASVIPMPFPVMVQLPFSCPIPGSLVEIPPRTNALARSQSWSNYLGSTFPDGAIGYGTVDGIDSALAAAGVTAATYTGTWRWHAEPFEAPAVDVDAPFSGQFDVAVGETATRQLPFAVAAPAVAVRVGTNTTSVDALSYVFRGTTSTGETADLGSFPDGDGDPTALTVTCSGPRTRISTVQRAPTPPWPGPSITVVSTTATSATIRFDSGSGTDSIAVRLDDGAERVISGSSGTVTFDGLTPNASHTVSAIARRVEDTPSLLSTKVFSTASASVPASLNGSSKFAVTGSLVGNAASQALVRGDLDAATGAFSGTTTIEPATGNTTALGLFGIRATFGFTEAGATTGTSSAANGFSLTTTQDVALKKATFLGLTVATGTCHTATPAAITLKSTTPGATLTTGGGATGTFQLGKLTGCSTFGSLFGTNGGRATLQVQLAPYPTQPPAPPTV